MVRAEATEEESMAEIAELEAKVTETRTRHLALMEAVKRGEAYPAELDHSLRALAALEDELSRLDREREAK